jgi:hypothetical protein
MAERFEVTADPQEWRAWLAEIGENDIHYSPEFAAVGLRAQPGTACCARYDGPAGRLVYPFLRRPIRGAEPSSDVTTPYDFGGYSARPAASGWLDLMEAFLVRWRGWCQEERIVSEFGRFQPLRFPPPGTEVPSPPFSLHQHHVVVDLQQGVEAARGGYTASCRRNVSKGIRAGLEIVVVPNSEALIDFEPMYEGTMSRRSAPSFYFFSTRFFEALFALPETLCLAVRDAGKTVASAIFVRGGNDLFYFLGASDPAAWSLRPNNVLFDKAVDWGVEQGLHHLHLGGGNEALRRFKRGFSSRRVPFYVLRCVHDPHAYEALAARVRPELRNIGRHHFPLYRAEESVNLSVSRVAETPESGSA